MDNSSLVFRSLFSIATNLILGGNPYEIQRKTSHIIIYIDFEVFLFPTILFHVHWNIFKKKQYYVCGKPQHCNKCTGNIHNRHIYI